MSNIAVVVPTLNNQAMGYEALASMVVPYDSMWMPIIIDNWNKNYSISQSWNLGIEIAIQHRVDYILIINDDILMSPYTVPGLLQNFQSPPVSNLVMVTAQNWRDKIAPNDILSIDPPSTDNEWNEHPDFSCFMITPKTYERIGSFDENFQPAYFEDNDYHRRIVLSGYKAISTSLAPYYHYGSQTQNKFIDQDMPVVPPIAFQLNHLYYVNKWGGDVGNEGFTHPYNDEKMTPRNWLPKR
jgi:hypothetical protein